MIFEARRASPFVAGAILVAGCNLVVGSGDYSVRDASAKMADGGGVGDDGGLPMPQSDATTDAPTGSDGGTTGEGGADGAGPACGETLPAFSGAFRQIVDACVLAVSCDPDYFETTVENCITFDYLNAFGSPCLAAVHDCASYYACVGKTVLGPSDCSGGANASCSSSGVATTCFADGSGSKYDCASFGGSCVKVSTTKGSEARCRLAGTCTDTTDDYHCDNNLLYRCDTGVEYGIDCTTIGATCQTFNGASVCSFDGPACTTTQDVCSGTTLDECTSAGRHFQYQCAAVGLQCGVDPTSGGFCAAPGCDKTTCTEQCSGSVLQTCVGGAPLSVDCVSLGFTGCSTGAPDRASKTQWTYCN